MPYPGAEDRTRSENRQKIQHRDKNRQHRRIIDPQDKQPRRQDQIYPELIALIILIGYGIAAFLIDQIQGLMHDLPDIWLLLCFPLPE